MTYKFAHISDTHIRNLKFHREYREVFSKIFERLRTEKPDYIVHCGDIAHTKTQLSPEYFEMCAWFLESLADIAPTYVIPGNHDGNLKNSTRQDALTPIVNALNHSDLHLLKSSGERVLQDDLALNVLSIFDEDNWQKPTDPDKINIALYHGSIGGVQTDTGYVMERGEHDISIFEDFDFGFLGDIHKTNQIVDTEGRVRYPGSTVQQNHGETNDKGFLIWNIRSKDDFDVEHVAIENPSPFITVELTPKGKIPKDVEIKEGARIRLAGNNSISLDVLRRAMDVAKTRFKPEAITYHNRATGTRGNVEDLANGLEHEDLRDPAVQEELIREFLVDYEVDDDVLERVLDLNKHYNTVAQESEETLRNIKWSLKDLYWDNLFNYGPNNHINFENLEGVIGIFGKNFTGKSSIVDSFLWTLQNSTSKNVRKNLNIINQNKNEGSGKVHLQVGNDMYVIERSSEKYVKKLKGEETKEAKTDLDFTKFDLVQHEKMPDGARGNKNGLDRRETDKNIRKVFGTLDDFLFTSMTSQAGSLAFINEGSTKRKEILGKFLDLDIFSKKFRLSSDDGAEIRGSLKRLEGREFDTEIEQAQKDVDENEVATAKQKMRCGFLKSEIFSIEGEVSELDKQIAALPEVRVWDVDAAKNKLVDSKVKLKDYEQENQDSFAFLKEKRQLLKDTEELLANFDVSDAEQKKKLVLDKQSEIRRILAEIRSSEEKLTRQNNKISLLNEVPCGDKFPTCKFLVDAHSAKNRIKETEQLVQLMKSERSEAENFITELKPESIDELLQQYSELSEQKNKIAMDISQKQVSVEKVNAKLIALKNTIGVQENEIEEYNKNKESVALLKVLHKSRREHTDKLAELNSELAECEEELLELYKSHGSLEQKLQTLEEQKGELSDLRVQYSAYDLYEKCMHSNGISYDIIKKRLPVINEEIAKVLANVVSFEVYFEDDGKKLDILIKHPKYDPRPLELGSGAEKMLAAMAIRLALIKISSLPQGDLFILDEPATALDEENMEGFIRIVDMLKTQFKTILVISHLDALKDIVDKQIVIDKKAGFAHVNM